MNSNEQRFRDILQNEAAHDEIAQAVSNPSANQQVLDYAARVCESFVRQANDFALLHADLSATHTLAYYPMQALPNCQFRELVVLMPNALLQSDEAIREDDAAQRFPHTTLHWPENS